MKLTDITIVKVEKASRRVRDLVQLQYYRPPEGFGDVITFTDSRSMFEELWEEWLNTKLFLLAKGTPMDGMGYSDIFKCLSEEKQKELLDRKKDFLQIAGIEEV